jgi:hypothetical protein
MAMLKIHTMTTKNALQKIKMYFSAIKFSLRIVCGSLLIFISLNLQQIMLKSCSRCILLRDTV